MVSMKIWEIQLLEFMSTFYTTPSLGKLEMVLINVVIQTLRI